MASATPEPKKRKLSALNGDINSSSDTDQTKVAALKLKKAAANGTDSLTMQTPPATDPNPKLSEFISLPPQPPHFEPPPRVFETDEMVKLTLLTSHGTTHVIVRIINGVFPHVNGSWQYCINADNIMPGGTGVIWVQESNLQKLNVLDISKGTTVQFSRNNLVLSGVVREAKLSTRPKDLVFEIDYTVTATVGMKDIVRVVSSGNVNGA